MNHIVTIIGLCLCAGVVIQSLRERQWLEAVGWGIFGASLSAVQIMQSSDVPRWVQGVFVGLAFAVSLPLGWIKFRRQWRRD
jgi:hypothetical protein